MTDAKPPPEDETPRDDLEAQLEEGLEDSFPASDPPSVARRHRSSPHHTGDVDRDDE
jgi:hypothetical protein